MKKIFFVLAVGTTMAMSSCSKSCTCTDASFAEAAKAAGSDATSCSAVSALATFAGKGTCTVK